MASATGLDRRWIFLVMGVLVVSLYVLGEAAEMPVNEYVQSYYDTIEALPEGTIVMLSADFDPASMAELLPMYQGTIHQLLRNNIRVLNVSTWPAAPPYTRAEFDRIAPQYEKVYGVDWVELGFKPGDDVAMGQIGQSVRSAYAKDDRNLKPLNELPLLNDVSAGFGGISLLITMSAGYPGILEWIAQAGGRYEVPILTGTTAVQTPDLYAYYPSQLEGFLGAATGATQYLQLVGEQTEDVHESRDRNQARMLIQSWVHIFIVLLIVVGNVLYFVGKRSAA
ncbi:MAG: hypothetical protein DRQ55_01150 [Planctomycetota bacterium]|nr:MAG: hypothetical protein DRQ55_01150 [Planctomycetota bacterium]